MKNKNLTRKKPTEDPPPDMDSAKAELPLRASSRRQASIEAKRQIQSASKKHHQVPETMDVSDEEVVEVPPKKKYKIISKKSYDDRNVLVLSRVAKGTTEATLLMECWSEPLSAVQLAQRDKQVNEHLEAAQALQTHIKKAGVEIIYESSSITALQVPGTINSTPATRTASKTKASSALNASTPISSTGAEVARTATIVPTTAPTAYSLVVDPKTGQVVGTVTPTSTVPAPPPIKAGSTISLGPNKKLNKVVVNANIRQTPALAPVSTTKAAAPPKPAAPLPIIPAVAQPSVVDLTEEMPNGKPTSGADSKEVSFNKLQGKTFPSLVVVAKPSLTTPPPTAATERAKLDQKVKQILMYPPGKFTEYLIQQGMIKSEQLCSQHPGQVKPFKLGMYSDVSKFPFSGGYVWLSECCAPKFVSVFQGSVFEVNPHPPSVPLKLIYHWACQTNIQNVIQWVKVDNLFIKGLYTWLRAICTIAIHTHIPQLGGLGVKVEIGVISLGTTTQDGSHRNVKVEVLGILETETRRIRLRAIEPCSESEKNSKMRFTRILEPLSGWVHPDTLIVTDLTVDKVTLHKMGFHNIVQHPQAANGGNSQIMDYLRKIVPRMFQNTLSLLSRQIIQQFLDELVWREWFGVTAAEAFDNIIRHLSEQTKVDAGLSLPNKLNKVALNPFKNWSIAGFLSREPNRLSQIELKKKRKQFIAKTIAAAAAASKQDDIPEKTVSLEPYYYGTIEGINKHKSATFSIKCPLCTDVFTNNISLMLHCFRHTSNADYFCKYCLIDCSSKHNLYTHLELKHTTETKAGRFFNCLICNDKFTKSVMLGKHLSCTHYPSELPYHCSSCTHKTSNHKTAIDHFYKVHKGQGMLQCPYCLRSMDLIVEGKVLSTKVNSFLNHLQNHLKRTTGKGGRRCNRCDLRFLYKTEVDDHVSCHRTYKKKPGLKPWPAPATPYVVPVSKNDEEDGNEDDALDLSNIVFNLPDNTKCKECNHAIITPQHFPDLMTCPRNQCNYATCCETSMNEHEINCDDLKKSIGSCPLEVELYCSCGYSDSDGNRLTDHLLRCERNSAYPTKEAALAACATNNMLDSLGLVRKPEETTDIAKEEKKEGKSDKKERKRKVSGSSDDSEDKKAKVRKFQEADEDSKGSATDEPKSTKSDEASDNNAETPSVELPDGGNNDFDALFSSSNDKDVPPEPLDEVKSNVEDGDKCDDDVEMPTLELAAPPIVSEDSAGPVVEGEGKNKLAMQEVKSNDNDAQSQIGDDNDVEEKQTIESEEQQQQQDEEDKRAKDNELEKLINNDADEVMTELNGALM